MKMKKGTLLIVLFLVQTIAYFGVSKVDGAAAPTQTWSPFGPRSDALLFRIITSYEARLAAFEADEIDAVGVRPDDLERIRKNRPDAIFGEAQAWGSQSIFFNMRNWPLSDVRVRKAVAHLIDREGYIMPEILKGYGLPLYTVLMPTLGSWFNPNVKTYEYSPDKANKYLDDAGFKWDAEHKWRLDPKTGERLRPIGLMTSTEAAAPAAFAIAVYFAKQCEKVGIKIQHEAVESAAVRTRRVRDTLEFDIYHWGWTGIGDASRDPTLGSWLFAYRDNGLFWQAEGSGLPPGSRHDLPRRTRLDKRLKRIHCCIALWRNNSQGLRGCLHAQPDDIRLGGRRRRDRENV